MSHLANDRALERLERTRRKKDNSLMSLVLGAERLRKQQRDATLALAAFAQELAGVEPPSAAPEAPRAASPSPRFDPVAAPPPPSRPVWGKDRWPGPGDVLTWDEVMRLPLIEENKPD